MANIIDILINAKWTGSGAVGKAGSDLRQLGNKATASSVEIAAAGAKTQLLDTAMRGLGQEVALGNLTVDQATDAYNQYAGTLADVSVAAPKAGINIAALTTKLFAATAAFTGLVVTAKKVGAAIREGAEIELTIQRFDRLAESVGTTGEALRKDLSIAARGLVTDLQLMATATDFLALGLAHNHDEAVRLANVSTQLGFNMNQLVLTMTNMTTMRFDALGVRVDGFKEKVAALEEAGLDAEEAFREAFLLQAEEQLKIVGSRADETAGQIDILTAAVKEMGDEAKLSLIEGVAPLIEHLTRGIDASDRMAAAVKRFQEALKDEDIRGQTDALREFEAALIDSADASERGIPIFPKRVSEDRKQALLDLIVALTESEATLEDQKRALEDAGFAVDDVGIKIQGSTIDWREFNKALEESRLKEIGEQMEEVDKNLENFIDTIKVATSNLPYLGQQIPLAELEEFAKEMGFSSEQARQLAIELGGTGRALGLLSKIEDPLEFLKTAEDIRMEALLKDAQLTNDEFLRLVRTLGSVQAAIDLLESSGSPFARIERPALQARFQPISEQTTELADLWIDFQADLTGISTSEGEQRAEAEANHEKRRTEIVNDFGARRAQEEANWQRRLLRQDQQLQRDIADVREDSADRQAELREAANLRLADLERDHLDRMTDIIDQADFDIAEAAARLDASAVSAIERQRKKALENEEEDYKKQREQIKRELERRLAEEQAASEERIAEMQEFHEERQKLEEEDRQFRLQQEQEAHDERLRKFDEQHRDRLDQITKQAQDERDRREIQYIGQRLQLDNHWRDRDQLERGWMNSILKAEAEFWNQRMGMIGGGDAGGIDTGGTLAGGGTGITGITPSPSGDGGGDGITGDNRPSRFWLEQQVIKLAQPQTTDAAFVWYQWMKDRTDTELAKWIEAHSDIDVPGYARGTLSAPGGLALLGEEGPELAQLPAGTRVFDAATSRRMMGRTSIESIEINVMEAIRPGDTAREVRREFERILEELELVF